jgi:hypothetical protein
MTLGEAMLCEPDVRWEGWSHKQIHERVSDGPGAAVTEQLEARLASVSRALYENSDQVNATLQRVDGGEWDGGTATAAAAAMRVMRDFDDILGHHGKLNGLAAYGQSDNAAWARANVPPYVDVRVLATPTGDPLDAFNATVDHHRALRAAKDAEERAREVMRQYQTMTTTRIAALPPLSPAPRLVVRTETDEPESALHPRSRDTDVVPHADQPDDGKSSPAPRPGAGERFPAGNTDSPAGAAPLPPGRDVTPEATDQQRNTLSAGTAPSGSPSALPDVVLGRWESASQGERSAAHTGARPESVLQDPRPGLIGTTPRPPRGGFTAAAGRSTGNGSPLGVVPGGHGRSEDDDKEHHDRYAVSESEFFEPGNDDGVLHDPFRPGSHVAPPAIGDDDE